MTSLTSTHRVLRHVAAAVLLLLGLAGCTTAPSSADSVELKAVKKIGVVSVVGQELVRAYVGLTVFNNEYGTEDFSGSGLDHHFESLVIDGIQKTGRQGLAVTLERARFSPADDGQFNIPVDALLPALKLGCQGSGADALLVVSKSLGQVPNTPVKFRGIAIWQHGRGAPRLSMNSRLTLVSCKDQKVLAHRIVGDSLGPDKSWLHLEEPAPARALISKNGKWTPEEIERTTTAAKNLGAKSLPMATTLLLGMN